MNGKYWVLGVQVLTITDRPLGLSLFKINSEIVVPVDIFLEQ
jgi:hypothetical protein